MNFRGIYVNLAAQFNSLYQHNRQGSKQTKHRYKEAFLRFLTFLADVFRLEKIANIGPKHIYAYVEYLTRKGRTVAYIKTELSATRFFHGKISKPKYNTTDLPGNDQLGLDKRQIGGVDRRWTQREFNMALMIAMNQAHEDYVALLSLARYAALRLHECFRLGTYDAEKALKTGKLAVKGKGGLVREVPINLTIEIELGKMLKVTPRGHKLFVAPDDETHLAMGRFESFLDYHKEKIRDAGSTRPLTFHGLRHTCAAEWYLRFIDEGMSDKEARLAVSRLLGHGRASVTNIYLAGLDNEDRG